MSTSVPDESITPTVLPVQRIETNDGPTIFGLLTSLLEGRRVVIGVALLAALVVGGIKLLSDATYTSSAAIIPQDRRSGGSLTGLAAQFGIDVPGGERTQSPSFYADLIVSHSMLGAVVDTKFAATMPDGSPATSLQEVYKSKGSTPALRRENAIKRLGGAITVTVVQKTGVVRLEVKAPSPSLAQQIAARLLELVSRFNLETRQTQAGAERRFTAQRVQDAKAELRAAEDELQQFLQSNRDFRNSPQLTFRRERLAGEVSMRQQVYQSLIQAYEQARIDAVRDTPVVTVVEAPDLPIQRDSRGTVGSTIVAFLAAALLMSLLMVVRGEMRHDALQSSERARFEQEMSETWRDLRRPWRLVLRGRNR